MDLFSVKNENLLEKSQELKNGFGSIAWATLEMLKRGGMPTDKITQLKEDINKYFAAPSSEECNTILRVVEKRLSDDKQTNHTWY